MTDIKNIWGVKDGKIKKNPLRPLVKDLDKLPFPNRSIYYDKYPQLKKLEIKRFISGRGCPYECSYCHNHVLKKIYDDSPDYVRKRSPEDLIKEIKTVKEKHGVDKVWFGEDTFTIDKNWLDNFVRLYRKELKIPFSFQTTANMLDRDVVKKVKEAGCSDIYLGVETGNERLRKKVLNKKISNEQIINASQLVKEFNINLNTWNMVGLPEESLEDVFRTIRFNRKLNPDIINCSRLKPFPKTQIANYAVQQGYLPKEFNLRKYNQISENLGEKVFFHQGSKKEATNLFYLFQIAVKSPKLMPIIKYMIKKPIESKLNFFWKNFEELMAGYFRSKYECGSLESSTGLKNFLKRGKLKLQSLREN